MRPPGLPLVVQRRQLNDFPSRVSQPIQISPSVANCRNVTTSLRIAGENWADLWHGERTQRPPLTCNAMVRSWSENPTTRSRNDLKRAISHETGEGRGGASVARREVNSTSPTSAHRCGVTMIAAGTSAMTVKSAICCPLEQQRTVSLDLILTSHRYADDLSSSTFIPIPDKSSKHCHLKTPS
jgi:hypothetical protein